MSRNNVSLWIVLFLPTITLAQPTRPVVRVGIKCDYPPDGFLDSAGKPI